MTAGRRTSSLVTALVAASLGFIAAALLHAYPKDIVARHRYCTVCASYEETYDEGTILGGEHSTKQNMSGPLHDLLSGTVGEHEHRYTEWATIFPTFGVEAQHPEVADTMRQVRHLQDQARAISLLEQATRNDPERATALMQRILEPGSAFPTQAINALDRDIPWPERWAAVDTALQVLRDDGDA